MTGTSSLCLLLWTVLQLYPCPGYICGPLFFVSFLLIAICSAPYRAARKLKESPLHIFLTQQQLIFYQGKKQWVFEIKEIQSLHSYSTGPLYGMRLCYKKSAFHWPFVEAALIKQLKIKYQLAISHAAG